MSIARHHAEWLSLVEVSGPFLSLPVLLEAFPQGLEAHDPDHHRLLRLAHDEWEAKPNNPATHNAWVRFVLRKTLDYAPEALAEGQAVPQTLHAEVAEHHEILRPDIVLKEPDSGKPRLLVQTYPARQDLTKPVPGLPWKASPDTRMTELLHATGVRLGLITNGERWMLVDAPRGETSGYASWYATLWLEEKITLQAFRSLLGLHRFFLADNETLEALLKKSAANQQEVTDQLGYQVRRAVEVLIQSLDRADQDHGRELLQGVREAELYEAALTVMMRLVFLFCAEERELLLLGDPLYNQNYALSTIREQLRAAADQFGEEVLERRHDAWCRLLVNFRAVHGGVWHDNFKLPPYGGRLFDPDRFPFLEGRRPGTAWRTAEARPLPVNNRTVLHLLEALQILQVKVPGGGAAEARRLSFRALDIEQIGHVYEGLLDHTAKRAGEPHLGLAGTKDHEPEVPLAKLEELRAKGENHLFKFLKEETGRSEPALKKALKAEFDAQEVSRFRSACQGESLWQRVQPFAGLVRLDSFGYPVVIPQGSVFVTEGTDRRSSGTHYTPRELTDPIVKYTLEPLVYDGPAEGLPKGQWKLKSAKELLDLKVCDMACGSGAFLVQACRYLSERLLEAWEQAEQEARPAQQTSIFGGVSAPPEGVRITPYGQFSVGGLYEQLVPVDLAERLTYARRIVAQRCLYGVDKNSLAVEMAKLSLWLLTLAKDKPFEFLDHAIRCGDSLVGIHDLRQLEKFNLNPDAPQTVWYSGPVTKMVNDAVVLRQKIESMPSNTVEDVEAQEKLLAEAEERTARLRCAADLLLSVEFQGTSAADKQSLHDSMAIQAGHYVENGTVEEFRQAVRKAMKGQQTFHWPLEFPEVFQKRGGFDAFVGNPPFLGGKRISTEHGERYERYLKAAFTRSKGAADLCCYFFRRAFILLRNRIAAMGLLATNSIVEGDSRDVGLGAILEDKGKVFRANHSFQWPGTAGVYASMILISRNADKQECFLGDTKVLTISAHLDDYSTSSPHRLKRSGILFSEGPKQQGSGFIITGSEVERMLEEDRKNTEVIYPYLNAELFNNATKIEASAWAINFGVMEQEQAAKYAAPFAHLTQHVKPYRDTLTRQVHESRFWLYWDKRERFFSAVQERGRILVCPRVTKYLTFRYYPPTWVFSEQLKLFDIQDHAHFSVLQSTLHECWARQYSGSLAETLRYSTSDAFETFPLPPDVGLSDDLCQAGALLYRHRDELMQQLDVGPTGLLNRFHAPDETSADIQKLRQLHVEMDQAVAAAYGWGDLDLGHGFHETKQGQRYTISESARREVLARLLKLNHERYAEEVRQGLHEKKKSSGKGRKKAESSDSAGTLFEEID